VKKHFGESLQRTAGLAAHKNHAFSISSWTCSHSSSNWSSASFFLL
jgi:hypothetical protein